LELVERLPLGATSRQPADFQNFLATKQPVCVLMPGGFLYVGHLKGRTLPVTAAKFANQIVVPKEIRASMGIVSGQKVLFMSYQG
jgi:hypothetical protein